MKKREARARRKLKTKSVAVRLNVPRLAVFRSGKHIYAQVIHRTAQGDVVLVSSSTKDNALKATLSGDKTAQAAQVGRLIAERAKAKNIEKITFDRSGYKYHGRVKSLADGAREAGLDF
jgi:large subunit ribosomal protein L18